MASGSNPKSQRPRPESRTSGTLDDSIQAPGVSDANLENGERPGPGVQLQNVTSSSGSATCAGGCEEKDTASILPGLSVMQDSASSPTDEDRWSLSIQLLHRFEHFGDLADVQRTISLLDPFIWSIPLQDCWYLAGLATLGSALLYRFEHLGELSDLEQAISNYREAVDFIPDGHHERPRHLNNLANAFRARFQRLGELDDLEQAISMHRNAVDLSPDSHPHKRNRLSSLGLAFGTRFERLGDLNDLEQAISIHGSAVDLTPDGHPDKPGYLNNLGIVFCLRFRRLGELGDLEQAISKYRVTVDLTPDGHPKKCICLNNLGCAFFTRFRHLGELNDLEQAIENHRKAVDLTPDGHREKPGHLNNLGNAFGARFGCLGELSDLEQAISRHKNAVDLTPDGHPDKHVGLVNLGIALGARFGRLGELNDLEQTISSYKDAVDLTPDDHPDRAGHLSNLGNAFGVRFGRLGELSDLEQAILMHRIAVDLTSHGHPCRPGRLGNLGNVLLARFERLGELSDLEQAISSYRESVDLTPHGHPDRPDHLNNLSDAFLIRFEYLGTLSDLEQAISRHKDAVDLTPDGHPSKPLYLNSLGIAFGLRFERLGELSDLERAISSHEDAVNLTPEGHPSRLGRLSNLGNAYFTRFGRLGEQSDLEQAISRHRDTIDLTPDGHPHKFACLNNLGNAFFTRFKHFGELGDLEQAILDYTDAVDLTPDGHSDKPNHLGNLGNAFRTRYERLKELSDLEKAISLYSQAACASTGPTTTRFCASQQWISCARAAGHHTLLHAYSFSIGLLPQLAWIGLSLTDRYHQLAQGADVVREAAAAALDSGLRETAVEWLKQGRSIVWGELFQLRSSYDELSAVHPEHARRLRHLSAALERASVTREKPLPSLSEQTQSVEHRATKTLEQEVDRHQMIAIERDKLLQEIRRLPGFERFLLHKEFAQLRASAHSGPVVILNAAESRCDALIVLANADNVIHVPLPNFTVGRSKGLQNTLKILLGHARATPGNGREGQREVRGRISWESVLSILWTGVVKPVLDALHFSTPGDLSRIFWCPTGPFAFFPIHAAGLYGTQYSQPGRKVTDFVVSSYTPTLSILASSTKPGAPPNGDLRLLTVRQSLSDGQPRLPGVDIELEHIKAVVQNSPSAQTILLESSVGTVEEVLGLMKEADWVHFACHGVQDAASPTDSGLCLADGRRLKLHDIITLARPHGGLAFLSACQTATGDEELSDEAIHIAAGMLFAGYGGVVGTMWSINDRLAPRVEKDVYGALFRNGARPDCRGAARALHDAVGGLRDGGASFAEWLPFIHVGL